MVKIADLLAVGRTFSFEFFPPKTDEARRQLEKAVHELAPLMPSFVSVTYGALGSTREFTRDAVVRINDEQLRLRDELNALGCTTPVIPSVFPVINVAGVRRMAAMNGSAIPAGLLERLEGASSADEVQSIGVDAATEICEQLIAADMPGIHLYPMNRSESVRRIYTNLGML